jgi:pimeloyl-ACP methyl ester carboxylesterase
MKKLWVVVFLLLLSCSHIPSPEERRSVADELAGRRNWQSISMNTGRFDLVAYLPSIQKKATGLTVYIEGDGFAWINQSLASPDPTPRDPVGLRLALAHEDGNAVYLARPCQYVDAELSGCPRRYWTEMRFAPEVVAATSQAIDVLKKKFGATQITLVGYSGGGAVAALLAAQRNDVERLITVAGNLDHVAWTNYHHISPLEGSLNPADQVEALHNIRQWHFVGADDANITPALVQGFANRFTPRQRPTVTVMPGFDHRCCWVENWASIWQQSVGTQ